MGATALRRSKQVILVSVSVHEEQETPSVDWQWATDGPTVLMDVTWKASLTTEDQGGGRPWWLVLSAQKKPCLQRQPAVAANTSAATWGNWLK